MNDFDRIWRMMDKFRDGDMDFDALEREFDKIFFQTLKKTIELCHNLECCPPPETLHESLCKAIECTPQIQPRKRKPKPKKKY